MQLITLQNFNIQTCFSKFLWFFSLTCWFKGQVIPIIHLNLPNAYILMCFDENINGNRDDKFLEWDYRSLHWPKKLTLRKVLCDLLNYNSEGQCNGWCVSNIWLNYPLGKDTKDKVRPYTAQYNVILCTARNVLHINYTRTNL